MKCPVCGREYQTLRGLGNHLKNVHPDSEAAARFRGGSAGGDAAQGAGQAATPQPSQADPAPAPVSAGSGEDHPGSGHNPVGSSEKEAQEQLNTLAQALGIDRLVEAVKQQQAQIAQLTRAQGEILQGAAPGHPGGIDLTKYGITPETIQRGVQMVMQALMDGGGGEDEELVKAIVAEEKQRKAVLMRAKVKMVYDAINNDLPLYAGEASGLPGPVSPGKPGEASKK